MMEPLLIKNILSNKDRKKLIKDCQPLLQDFSEEFPGKQTNPHLHKDPRFSKPIRIMMRKVYMETRKNFYIKKTSFMQVLMKKNHIHMFLKKS